MVIRSYVKCKTCGNIHLVRSGVGVESYEIQSFDCLSCGMPIVIAVRANVPQAYFEAEENAIFVQDYKGTEKVVNLHPCFAFSKEIFHSEQAFPSLEYMHKIYEHLRKTPGKFQDITTQFDLRNAKNLWGIVKNIIALEQKENKKQQDKLISQYKSARKDYVHKVIVRTYKDVVISFFDALFYPKINELINPIFDIVKGIEKKYSDHFQDFYEFYCSNMQSESINRYVSIFIDYFKCRSELNPMLVHARIGDFDTNNKIVGSRNFETVKLFYGQAYETLTSQFFVLACLNNIRLGRKYDTFSTMTLKKYLKDVEKSKRANPFKEVPAMANFSLYLNSTIRNGSHHASFWREGEILKYRSGGSGAEHDISYSHYLYLCNELTIALAALFTIEIILFDINNGYRDRDTHH